MIFDSTDIDTRSGAAGPATASSGNNGNVAGFLYQDSATPANGYTASFTYDYMNRLWTSVASPAQNGGPSYSQTYLDYSNPNNQKGYD